MARGRQFVEFVLKAGTHSSVSSEMWSRCGNNKSPLCRPAPPPPPISILRRTRSRWRVLERVRVQVVARSTTLHPPRTTPCSRSLRAATARGRRSPSPGECITLPSCRLFLPCPYLSTLHAPSACPCRLLCPGVALALAWRPAVMPQSHLLRAV